MKELEGKREAEKITNYSVRRYYATWLDWILNGFHGGLCVSVCEWEKENVQPLKFRSRVIWCKRSTTIL